MLHGCTSTAGGCGVVNGRNAGRLLSPSWNWRRSASRWRVARGLRPRSSLMRVAVLGLGATGSHVARQLRTDAEEILLYDADRSRLRLVRDALEVDTARPCEPDGEDADVVVLTVPTGMHLERAKAALRNGANVISVSDRPSDVEGLLQLDALARDFGKTVVVGAGFAPGMTCLLARHAATLLDEIDSVAVAKAGTGGPACARQHHRALKRAGRDWIDGSWVFRRGGSGRELAWFPEPIGARDCYRADLPSPLLLHRLYPDAARISARVSATRRDRFTKWLPMLRPPHADGGPGAIRVEVRGRRNGAVETVVYGAMAHPSVAGGMVAAVSALSAANGAFAAGATGLAEVDDPLTLLQQLHERGLRAATYEGSAALLR